MNDGSKSGAPPRHAGQRATERTPGLIGRSLQLVYWLFLALVVSIIVEWVGMTFWWTEQGSDHSAAMLDTELGYLSGDLRRSLLVSDAADYARSFADFAYRWLWQQTGLERAALWAAETPPEDATSLRRSVHGVYALVAAYVASAANITQVFAVRLAVLSLAMPAFLLAVLVGALDGFVIRDLRKWCGGRESSYVYHHAKRWIWPVFVGAWVFYLSLPTSVHPAMSILPFAAVVGILVAVTAASFKKYL